VEVSQHVGLVRKVMRRFAWHPNAEDLFQAGMLGLWRATQSYREGEGAFSTYATTCIWRAVVLELQNHGRTIRIPIHRHRKGELPPTTLSLDAPIGYEGDSTLMDFQGEPPRQLDALLLEYDKDKLWNVLALLTERERIIIRRREVQGWSFDKIGAEIGYSHEQARKLHAKAIVTLRKKFNDLDKGHPTIPQKPRPVPQQCRRDSRPANTRSDRRSVARQVLDVVCGAQSSGNTASDPCGQRLLCGDQG
jgi:RNA polymerase sigma factor (sigma-70 family)